MTTATNLGDALDRYVALLDEAAIGRICHSGKTAHDGLGPISAQEIRDLRDAELVTIISDWPASWEDDPDEEGCCRDVVGDYNPELGSWQFLVAYAGTRFVVTAKERSRIAVAALSRGAADA